MSRHFVHATGNSWFHYESDIYGRNFNISEVSETYQNYAEATSELEAYWNKNFTFIS